MVDGKGIEAILPSLVLTVTLIILLSEAPLHTSLHIKLRLINRHKPVTPHIHALSAGATLAPQIQRSLCHLHLLSCAVGLLLLHRGLVGVGSGALRWGSVNGVDWDLVLRGRSLGSVGLGEAEGPIGGCVVSRRLSREWVLGRLHKIIVLRVEVAILVLLLGLDRVGRVGADRGWRAHEPLGIVFLLHVIEHSCLLVLALQALLRPIVIGSMLDPLLLGVARGRVHEPVQKLPVLLVDLSLSIHLRRPVADDYLLGVHLLRPACLLVNTLAL